MKSVHSFEGAFQHEDRQAVEQTSNHSLLMIFTRNYKENNHFRTNEQWKNSYRNWYIHSTVVNMRTGNQAKIKSFDIMKIGKSTVLNKQTTKKELSKSVHRFEVL